MDFEKMWEEKLFRESKKRVDARKARKDLAAKRKLDIERQK